MDSSWTGAVADRLRRLPRKGKPAENEWTVVAAIAATWSDGRQPPRLLVLATGLKCLGAANYSRDGDVVHDSHAEVLARRGLQACLLQEMGKCAAGQHSDIVEANAAEGKAASVPYRMRDEVQLRMYISQTPCGDASIFPSERRVPAAADAAPVTSVDAATPQQGEKRTHDTAQEAEPPAKFARVEVLLDETDGDEADDVQRTGAKCVPDGPQDPMLPGQRYHVCGALRTKPGRGHPTESLSCSDKLARWTVLGCQGGLLACLIEPVYLHSVEVASLFNEPALRRALCERLAGSWSEQLPATFRHRAPLISPSAAVAPFDRDVVKQKLQDSSTLHTSDAAIVWVIGWDQPDVIVKGRLQGAAPKHGKYSAKTRSRLCRMALFAQAAPLSGVVDAQTTYDAFKQRASGYQRAKEALLSGPLHGWLRQASEFRQFSLGDAQQP